MKINIVQGVVFVLGVLLFSACSDKYDVNDYHSEKERDSLLTDIITYVYVRPQYADWQTRFEPRFRKYYVSQLGKFRFEKYFIDDHGNHYYYLIRPARSAQGNIRGVGGTFRRDASGKIVNFKETFNTPVAALPDLQTRGEELFRKMVKYGNVNDYLRHPDYIEWPDAMTYYDTIQHEWLVKPGI